MNPTLEQVRAEIARRKAATPAPVAPVAPAPTAPAPATGGITLDAIRAEKARRAANGAGMSSVNPMEAMGLAAQRQALIGQRDRIKQGEVQQVTDQQRVFGQDTVDRGEIDSTIRSRMNGTMDASGREKWSGKPAQPFDEMGMPAQSPLDKTVGAVATDVGKGTQTAIPKVYNGMVRGAESILNLPSDVADFAGSFSHNPDGSPAFGKSPRFDFSEARVGFQPEQESLSGGLLEGLAQFLVSRKLVGTIAPGGGMLPQLGKDAAATGIGFDGSTGRVADMLPVDKLPEGPLRDYAMWLRSQPEDSALVGRFKNLIEDMTLAGPMLAPHTVVRGAEAGIRKINEAVNPQLPPTNAGGARPGPINPAAVQTPPAPAAPPVAPTPANALASPPAPAQAASRAQPSVAPVSPVPQTPPGAGQSRAASAGQQAAQPVINAVPAGPAPIPKQQRLIDRDTVKITRRIMRSAGIKDADVMGYLSGAVQRFKSLNDERVPLAFFIKRDLADHFSEPVADQVRSNLDVWGRAQNAETGPRATINKTVSDLRKSQQDFLTKSAEANLFKGSLIGQEDQIISSLRETGRKGYEPIIDHARAATDGRRAPSPAEAEALDELKEVMSDPMMQGYVDDATRIRAKKEGIDLDTLIKQDPVGASHWLQSEFRRLSDAAEDPVTGKATRMSQAYDDLRDMILDPLKRAAPGYEGAMNRYGHQFGAKEAVRFGKGWFTAARSAYETAQKVRAFKKLGRRQQTVAMKSIRDEYLNEFRGTPEEAAAKITRMQSEGSLDLLDQLGARGKRFADDIRKIAQVENPNLKAIEQASGSPTYANARGGANAVDMVQDPLNKAVGSFGDKTSWPVTIGGDLLLASKGLPPIMTASKVGSALVDRFGNPSRKVRARATEGLYGLPQKAPPAPTRTIPPSRNRPRVAEAADDTDMEALLKQFDAVESDTGTRGGQKGRALLNKIDAANKVAAPKTPRKKPLPGETSNSPAAVGGALVGGGLGYISSDGDPRATLAGALGGSAIGYGAGRLGSKPPKPPKGAPVPKAPVAAEVRAAERGPVPSIEAADLRPAVAKNVTTFNPKKPEPPRIGQTQNIASVTTKDGRQYDVTAEVFKDRDAVVMSPSYPSNIADDLAGALKHQQSAIRAQERGLGLANDAPRAPDWATENPTEWGDVQRQVGERFLGMVNSTPGPHVLALVDGIDLNSLGTLIEDGLPKGKVLMRSADNGEFAVVDRLQPLPEQFQPSPNARTPNRWETYSNLRWNQKQGILPPPADWANAQPASPPLSSPSTVTVTPFKPTPKPPVVKNGFGSKLPMDEGAKPKAPPTNNLSGPPKFGSRVPGIIARRAATGLATGAAVNLATSAGAQDDITGKISATEQTIAGLNKSLADFDKITDPFEKQRFLKDAGFYAGKIDGNIAGATTKGIEQWQAKQEAAIDKAEAAMTELVRRNAYQKNQPNPLVEGLHEYGPTAAFVAALFGMKGLRGGAAKKSIQIAEVESKKLNRLIGKGPMTSIVNKDDVSRPASLNTLWKKGGAGNDELPFKQDSNGNWKPNSNAKAADELFEDDKLWQSVSKYIKGKDIALILGGGLDASGMQIMIDKSNRELAEAEAEWKANPSDETFKKVQDAKSAIFAYTTLRNIGVGLAGGRLLGSIGKAYAKPHPNIERAATEQSRIKEYIAANKPPPRPRSVKPSPPPSPRGRRGNGKKP